MQFPKVLYIVSFLLHLCRRHLLQRRFLSHGRRCTFRHAFRALRHKQDLHRSKADPQILHEAGIRNIHQIHLKLIVGRCIVFPIYLGVACESGFCLEP